MPHRVKEILEEFNNSPKAESMALRYLQWCAKVFAGCIILIMLSLIPLYLVVIKGLDETSDLKNDIQQNRVTSRIVSCQVLVNQHMDPLPLGCMDAQVQASLQVPNK